jgi:hypothetical protein
MGDHTINNESSSSEKKESGHNSNIDIEEDNSMLNMNKTIPDI